MVIRVFFIVIQLILLLIFEHRMHFFQQKQLAVILMSAGLILGGTPMNPFFTFWILYFTTTPWFNRVEVSVRDEIDEAFLNDVNLDLYDHKKAVKRQQDVSKGLPGVNRVSTAQIIDKSREGVLWDFTNSIALLTFLLSYRQELTPRVFHLLTYMEHESVKYSFVICLWLVYKCSLSLDPVAQSMLSQVQV